MIDLHCHILPGVDDGARDPEESVAMAHVAVEDGIERVVATPHVRHDYPLAVAEIPDRVAELGRLLDERGVPVEVVGGAEVAIPSLVGLEADRLRAAAIGGGPYMLVESPYEQHVPLLDEVLFRLQLQGLRPILAHPERCPTFHADPAALRRLVDRGVLCSVTAASMAGRFGQAVRRFTAELLREELVHNVASDAHDAVDRPPRIRDGFSRMERQVPGLDEQRNWYVLEVPAAILAGDELPERPRLRPRRSWLRTLGGGRG